MIDNIIKFFKNIFGIKPPVKNHRSKPVHKKAVKSEHSAQKQSPKSISSHDKYKYLKKYKNSDRYGNTLPDNIPLEKNYIMKKIKKNIFFLNQLVDILIAQDKYESYSRKVNELKSQSEGCYKIVFRIKEEAPYFHSTMRTVLHHTQTISIILKIK